jgi:hypothetical protein
MDTMKNAMIFCLKTIISHNPTDKIAREAQGHLAAILVEDFDTQKDDLLVSDLASRIEALEKERTHVDPVYGGQDAGLAGVGESTKLNDNQSKLVLTEDSLGNYTNISKGPLVFGGGR